MRKKCLSGLVFVVFSLAGAFAFAKPADETTAKKLSLVSAPLSPEEEALIKTRQESFARLADDLRRIAENRQKQPSKTARS